MAQLFPGGLKLSLDQVLVFVKLVDLQLQLHLFRISHLKVLLQLGFKLRHFPSLVWLFSGCLPLFRRRDVVRNYLCFVWLEATVVVVRNYTRFRRFKWFEGGNLGFLIVNCGVACLLLPLVWLILMGNSPLITKFYLIFKLAEASFWDPIVARCNRSSLIANFRYLVILGYLLSLLGALRCRQYRTSSSVSGNHFRVSWHHTLAGLRLLGLPHPRCFSIENRWMERIMSSIASLMCLVLDPLLVSIFSLASARPTSVGPPHPLTSNRLLTFHPHY